MYFNSIHPQRQALNDELHARPPVPLSSPSVVTFLAFVREAGTDDGDEVAHVRALAGQLGLELTTENSGHILLDAGQFQLKWERHNEFSSYTFIRPLDPKNDPDRDALLDVPAGWRRAIPGDLLVASQVRVLRAEDQSVDALLSDHARQQERLSGSHVEGGGACVFSDFRVHGGFTHFTLINEQLNPLQTGRTVQRIIEIETYRIMALLAFPVARSVGQLLTRTEQALAALMTRINENNDPDDEASVLDALTRLAAEIERSVASTTYRFGASAAYYQLVHSRIADLRELRFTNLPTLGETMSRRLNPALDTCATIARRQEDLSGRIARNSQLLRTRVDIALKRQNQELLTQMNQRARLQLRLQETVEGLSIVAITLYASQLVDFLARGARTWIAPATPEVITALAIPVIAVLTATGMSRMRRRLSAEKGKD